MGARVVGATCPSVERCARVRDVATHVASARALVVALAPVSVGISDALGRVLAADVIARAPSPPFTNSAMDGYALHRADVLAATASDPAFLNLVGESAAGSPSTASVGVGEAVRIMTGAVLPAGADAIVPVELATDDGHVVTVGAEPAPMAHIRHAGEDVKVGDVVVPAGSVLTPARLAAAASVGYGVLDVAPRPVVGILSTGDELVEPGHARGPGQIADSNGVVLAGLVRAAGATPNSLGRVGDDPEALFAALEGVAADIIVTTGGVSAGAYDVVKESLRGRGVDFASVAMQPGKPQGLGTFNGTPLVCLPGNPVSVLVSFAVIVRPMLRVLTGETPPQERWAVAASGWRCPKGRAQYMPVRLLADGRVEPATAGGSGSHLVASLASADALAVVAAEADAVAEGDSVCLMEISG